MDPLKNNSFNSNNYSLDSSLVFDSNLTESEFSENNDPPLNQLIDGPINFSPEINFQEKNIEQLSFVRFKSINHSLNQEMDSNKTPSVQKRKFSALNENFFQEEDSTRPALKKRTANKRTPKKLWNNKDCEKLQNYLNLAKEEKFSFISRLAFAKWTKEKNRWTMDRDEKSISSHLNKIHENPTHSCSILLKELSSEIFIKKLKNPQTKPKKQPVDKPNLNKKWEPEECKKNLSQL